MQTNTTHILTAYHKAAEAARDGEFYVRCAQRKTYLTREVVERWHIGKAPTLGQCKACGLSEAQLRSVGLLVRRDYGDQLFFRDCMLFPFFLAGEIVYIASRRLVDHDPRTGEALSKSAKALSMRAPDSHGHDGVQLNTGFQVDVIESAAAVMLVEGPLDAIACTERGHPAIAMIGKCPRPGLLASLRTKPIPIYLALDGTADVTEEERLSKAALVGPDCWICTLPEGRDPDDLDGDELTAVKTGARQCSEAWLEQFKRPPTTWKQNATDAFKGFLRRWLIADPDRADDLRARVCGALGLRPGEFDQLTGSAKIIAPGAAAADADDLSPEAQGFLDEKLRDRLASIQTMDGSARDREIVTLLHDLAPHLVGASSILRSRVKSQVCEILKIAKRDYDLGLREARKELEISGVMVGGEVDWMALAKGYLCAIRSGQLATN
jgi:hypothetical protein